MWRAWFQKHKNFLWAPVALSLTFMAGWQVGRVTSPYYAAHPIIFQESAASPAAIGTLLATGIPSVSSDLTPPPGPSADSSQTNKTEGKYVASVNSTLYHDASCSSAKQIKPANQVWFDSHEEAEAAGYSPSTCTKEKLGL